MFHSEPSLTMCTSEFIRYQPCFQAVIGRAYASYASKYIAERHTPHCIEHVSRMHKRTGEKSSASESRSIRTTFRARGLHLQKKARFSHALH